jgi:hypothetical protein
MERSKSDAQNTSEVSSEESEKGKRETEKTK